MEFQDTKEKGAHRIPKRKKKAYHPAEGWKWDQSASVPRGRRKPLGILKNFEPTHLCSSKPTAKCKDKMYSSDF